MAENVTTASPVIAKSVGRGAFDMPRRMWGVAGWDCPPRGSGASRPGAKKVGRTGHACSCRCAGPWGDGVVRR
jgi:hypothetical protein